MRIYVVAMQPYLQGGARGGMKAGASKASELLYSFPLGRFKGVRGVQGARSRALPVAEQARRKRSEQRRMLAADYCELWGVSLRGEIALSPGPLIKK